MRNGVLFLLLGLLSISFSQSTAIGEWKNYFPFRSVIDVVKNGNVVYGATENGIIVNNYQEGTTEKLTEVNALSDNNITAIDFNVTNNALIVAYANGNADIIVGNETTNLFQIKESNLTGDKTIYDIFCKGNFAYLSCGFGIVVFDVSKKEIKDTYIIGPSGSQLRVNTVVINNNVIYAGTESGLYTASESSPFLTDFNSWTKSTSIPSGNKQITQFTSFKNKIIANVEFSSDVDSIYTYDGTSWGRINTLRDKKTNSVYGFNNRLTISHYDTVYVLDTNFSIEKTFTNYDAFWKIRANYVMYDGSHYYIGDGDNALVKFTDNFNADREEPKSIFTNNVVDIEVVDGNLWGATGSVVGGGWNKTYSNDGIFHHNIRENDWRIYSIRYLNDQYCFSGECMNDFIGVAVDPKRPKVGIACSFSVKGMAELANNKLVVAYDSANSSLQISSVHGDRFAVADAAFDANSNLWAVNSWAAKALSVRTAGGSWKGLNCGTESQNTIASKIIIAEKNGYKWIVFKDKHLLAYHDNETPLDESDDSYKVVKGGAANGNLDAIPICVAEDKDGEIWIGTENGIYVIYTPSEIFNSGSFSAEKIKIEQDGNIEFLLENEIITSVIVDGGNRKWIGTQGSGIFVLSPDGTTQLNNFTEENSPLLSNTINDIAIDGETGEVFIATDKGLISYKGEATEGQQTYLDVYAYPNPVPPGYNGKIAIKGLVANSDVRITDVVGNVVFSTKSIGGQAIWDGNKLDGARASSGIYLVFMTNEDGNTSEVSKILFMK